uniref:Uncharacterized protein n=1 Tax=Arcella intermedia TaxID=1963864 RepID=A0A6B2LK54_9EUKA
MIGKTSLVRSYATAEFPGPYTPTASDTYSVNVLVATKPITFSISDTGGKEEYDQLRIIAYPNTDIFLCCFSVDSPDSFEHVRSKWFPELSSHCPTAPILLVGTKMDLAADEQTVVRLKKEGHAGPVTREQALAMVQDIGALSYVPCSSVTRQGVKEVFDAAIRALSAPSKPKNGPKDEKCCLQ